MKLIINEGDLPATLNLKGFPPIEMNWERRTQPECVHNADERCPVAFQPRPDGDRFTFIMRGFDDEASAGSIGRHLADVLTLTGAKRNLGIDVGFDRSDLQFSSDVHRIVREIDRREIRGDLIGLMTYRQGFVRICSFEAYGFGTRSVSSFEEMVSDLADTFRVLTEKQRRCAVLLNDALYTTQPEAQFVLCVTAVESLCDRSSASAEHLELIDQLRDALTKMDGSAAAKKALQDHMERARIESIRQSYLRKIEDIVDRETAKRFDQLYKFRSSFVHDGKGRGDLRDKANEARQIAVRLLISDLSD